ncbi:hypothetical protein AVANS14531_05045 [Campylobacter sp. Cr9]|uniref:hypothetical protein n=1 Tax=Campylobacter sp. Cr9 TaxID=2735728 RepID=UPI00301539A1|nr:hypothetical protein [Campylobacter sp. Cr9]
MGEIELDKFVIAKEIEEENVVNLDINHIVLSEEEIDLRKKLDIITEALGSLSDIRP